MAGRGIRWAIAPIKRTGSATTIRSRTPAPSTVSATMSDASGTASGWRATMRAHFPRRCSVAGAIVAMPVTRPRSSAGSGRTGSRATPRRRRGGGTRRVPGGRRSGRRKPLSSRWSMTSTETSLERGFQRRVTSRPFWLRCASSLTATCDMAVPFWWLTEFTRRSCVSTGTGRARGDPTPTPDLSAPARRGRRISAPFFVCSARSR